MTHFTVVSDDTVTARPTRRGFVPGLFLSNTAINMAMLTPVAGGLAVKIQSLVGLSAAPTQLGLVTGVGAIFALVVQPLAGRMSDRTTSRLGMRRPWIIAGAAGLALSLIACGLAPNIPMLLLAWCSAQTFANLAFAAQNATIADQVPEERRGLVSGLFGAGTAVGILIGVALLAVLGTDLLRLAVPGVLGAGCALVFAVFVLDDRVRDAPVTTPLGVRQLLGSFVFDPRVNPDFAWAWLSKLLILTGFGAATSFLTLFLGARFGMSTSAQLSFTAQATAVAIGASIVTSLVGGVASDRVGRRKPFVIVSGLVVAAGVALIAVSPAFGSAGLSVILLGEALSGAGAGLFLAVDQAMCLALLPDENDAAKDLGVLNIASTLPSSVSPLLAGLVVIPLGDLVHAGSGYSVWFLVASAIAVTGSVLVVRIRKVR